MKFKNYYFFPLLLCLLTHYSLAETIERKGEFLLIDRGAASSGYVYNFKSDTTHRAGSIAHQKLFIRISDISSIGINRSEILINTTEDILVAFPGQDEPIVAKKTYRLHYTSNSDLISDFDRVTELISK